MLVRHADALQAVDDALAASPRDALTFDTLGVVLSLIGAHERAVQLFGRAVAAAPDNAGFQYNLASSLRFVGAIDAAEAAYEAALRAAPKMWRAHFALSSLRRQTRERNHIPRLLAALDAVGGDVDAELLLRHALAKEYDDIAEPDEAFRHLEAGKARKRAEVRYSIGRDRALFEAVEAACDAAFAARVAGAADSASSTGSPDSAGLPNSAGRAGTSGPTAEVRPASRPVPIFVVGMPRTGTTLVDRILSSHSQVASAGELQAFGLCVRQAAGTRTGRMPDPDTIRAAAEADFAALGEAYLERARIAIGAEPFFVDKMPLNFFYVGFIRAALPQAKIVCLRRDPLDAGLANFRQLFALGFGWYDYTYDLADIGRYYAMFDRLIGHWDRVLPGSVLTIRYEALVTDQERQTRRLLEFCGLPWEAACLEFHSNTAPVATASATQVREPLHRRSIGRWKGYVDHLAPLIAELEAAGIPLSTASTDGRSEPA